MGIFDLFSKNKSFSSVKPATFVPPAESDYDTQRDKRTKNKNRIQYDYNKFRNLGIDLVTISVHPKCPICSRYRGIVYSINQNNKRYPFLPSEVYYQTHECTEHAMTLDVYMEGISTPPRK